MFEKYEILDENNWEEFEEFNKNHAKGHIFQSRQWAELKKDWIREVVIVRRITGEIVAGMSVLVRQFSKYSFMYSPRGPVAPRNNRDAMKQLGAAAKVLAEKYNAIEFKIDPDVLYDDTDFLFNLSAAGFRRTDKFIQPKIVYRLDMQDLLEEELMAKFSSKTRYNIRLAQKRGVVVSQTKDATEFYRLLQITGERDGFKSRDIEYFQRMLDVLGDDYCRLYVAQYKGEIIAATMALSCGDKTWYIYGASDNNHRNVMPNYLLQMNMIRWAIENKSRIYDFRGVTDYKGEILDGLVNFKKGFAGKETNFTGEWRIIYKPFMKICMDMALFGRKKLRSFKIFIKKG